MATDKNKYRFDEKGFNAEYRSGFGECLLNLLVEFINTKNIDDKAKLNTPVFEHYLIDVFADLARLSDFHNCEKPNYEKTMSYCASWWIRRKPLSLLVEDENFIYLNEEFAFYLVLHAIDIENLTLNNRTKVEEALEKLIYHLKYRYVNPQTLELFIQGISLGLGMKTN